MFSYNYVDSELEKVKKIIPLIKKFTNKEIILTTNNPIFSLYGSRFTDLDFFLIQKKRKPNDNELAVLEKKYYNFLQNNNSYKYFNIQIKELSKKHNLKLLDKSLYQCDDKDKKCLVLTQENQKINWDSDHHTLNGAKYLGEIINKKNWFQIE